MRKEKFVLKTMLEEILRTWSPEEVRGMVAEIEKEKGEVA